MLHIDWTKVELHTDADALALWAQIAPTGDDWELRLREVPSEGDLRRQLALALLRAGNFRCAALPTCDADAYVELSPTSTLADPCLRRELALWAFEQLDDTDAIALQAALLKLVSLPPPEEELVRAAFFLVPLEHDDLLLPMIEAARAAGQLELADESVRWLEPAHRIKVATQLHSDGAYAELEVDEARPAFLAAINDRKLKAATSVTAIDELLAADDGLLRKDVRAALVTATKDPRCAVAAAAARQLADAGDRRFVPRRNPSSVAAALRALCVMASYSEEDVGAAPVFAPFISASGVSVFDHTEALEPDGEITADHLPRAEAITLPFMTELEDALEHCEGTTCRTDDLRFELTLAPDKTLLRIERFSDPSNCNKQELITK